MTQVSLTHNFPSVGKQGLGVVLEKNQPGQLPSLGGSCSQMTEFLCSSKENKHRGVLQRGEGDEEHGEEKQSPSLPTPSLPSPAVSQIILISIFYSEAVLPLILLHHVFVFDLNLPLFSLYQPLAFSHLRIFCLQKFPIRSREKQSVSVDKLSHRIQRYM